MHNLAQIWAKSIDYKTQTAGFYIEKTYISYRRNIETLNYNLITLGHKLIVSTFVHHKQQHGRNNFFCTSK